MNFKNYFKKGQSLPLNTIVIAMLVIVVLLVIIVFFTNSVSKSGKTIDENSPTACSMSNPTITTMQYTDVKYEAVTKDANGDLKCSTTGYNKISFIPSFKGTVSGDQATPDDTATTTVICCGKK